MLNIYTALGGVGEDCKGEIAKAIKYAGDFPFGVNAVTLLRESGISEYL